MKIMQPQSPQQVPPGHLPAPQLGPPGQPTTPPLPPVTPPESPSPQPLQAPQPSPAPSTYLPPGQTDPAPPHASYDFIMNTSHPSKSFLNPKLPGKSNAKLIRVLIAGGGLLLLMIVFSLVKGLFTTPSNKPLLLAVAQNQQRLIHLVTLAKDEPTLSTPNKNFAATAQLSLTSGESDMIAYLGKAGMKKIGSKVLNQKVSTTTDDKLQAAIAADTYNQTFHDIMKAGLDQYQQSLQAAYDKTTGQNGRKLLKDQSDQSDLLVQQLDSSPTH